MLLPADRQLRATDKSQDSKRAAKKLFRGWEERLINNCISLAEGGGEELLGASRGSTRRNGQVVPYGIIGSNRMKMNKTTLKADSGKHFQGGEICSSGLSLIHI